MVLRKLFLDVGSAYKKKTEPTSVVLQDHLCVWWGGGGTGRGSSGGGKRKERKIMSQPVMTVSPEDEK